uniref:Peptidase C76 domain-containing protein n=1 Tax=Anguilla anguilla TaxID=7936 RepID=A0A0E9U9N6_ANGAN
MGNRKVAVANSAASNTVIIFLPH